jgi:hypothetical protein
MISTRIVIHFEKFLYELQLYTLCRLNSTSLRFSGWSHLDAAVLGLGMGLVTLQGKCEMDSHTHIHRPDNGVSASPHH